MSEITSTLEPKLITLPVSEIKEYENNPRRISPRAIEGVKHSIQSYGYVQPIVVDMDNVIVVGHTRFLAMKELGHEEILVQQMDLPKEKADEYRLVDNRTGEMGEWDQKSLVLELREFEAGLLEGFFPEVDLEIVATTASDVTTANVEDATKAIERVASADPRTSHTTKVVCPSCYYEFDVRTKSLPGLTWEFLEGLVEDGNDG